MISALILAAILEATPTAVPQFDGPPIYSSTPIPDVRSDDVTAKPHQTATLDWTETEPGEPGHLFGPNDQVPRLKFVDADSYNAPKAIFEITADGDYRCLVPQAECREGLKHFVIEYHNK